MRRMSQISEAEKMKCPNCSAPALISASELVRSDDERVWTCIFCKFKWKDARSLDEVGTEAD